MPAYLWIFTILVACAPVVVCMLITSYRARNDKTLRTIGTIAVSAALIFTASVRISYHSDTTEYATATVLKTDIAENKHNHSFMVWVTFDNETSICTEVEQNAYGLYDKGDVVTMGKRIRRTWLFGEEYDWIIVSPTLPAEDHTS